MAVGDTGGLHWVYITPEQIALFGRGQRYHILPAYTIDDIIYYEVHQSSKATARVEAFLERLVPFCNPSPGPGGLVGANL